MFDGGKACRLAGFLFLDTPPLLLPASFFGLTLLFQPTLLGHEGLFCCTAFGLFLTAQFFCTSLSKGTRLERKAHSRTRRLHIFRILQKLG